MAHLNDSGSRSVNFIRSASDTVTTYEEQRFLGKYKIQELSVVQDSSFRTATQQRRADEQSTVASSPFPPGARKNREWVDIFKFTDSARCELRTKLSASAWFDRQARTVRVMVGAINSNREWLAPPPDMVLDVKVGTSASPVRLGYLQAKREGYWEVEMRVGQDPDLTVWISISGGSRSGALTVTPRPLRTRFPRARNTVGS